MKKVITHELLSIQRRFFDVLDILLSSGEIKGGLKGFCELAGLNRVKYSHIRSSLDAPLEERPNGQSYRVIDIESLSFLCREYRVSSDWLLLGRGSMFVQPTRRRKKKPEN